MQLEVSRQLTQTEKGCLRIIESGRKERLDVEKRLSYQLNSQLDMLLGDIHKHGATTNYSDYLDTILQEDVARYSSSQIDSRQICLLKLANVDKSNNVYLTSLPRSWLG